MDNKQSYSKRRTNNYTYQKHKHLSGFELKRAEAESLQRKFKNLKATHDLQNRTVRHFMHNIMSPLSAVSGYLELLSNNLPESDQDEKLLRYTGNISDGLNQIGFLLEQLHEIVKEDDSTIDGSECPVVELNWLVNEVVKIAVNTSGKKSSIINFKRSDIPVFVKGELFQLKLMIYNLVSTAESLSIGNDSLEIEMNHYETDFALLIKTSGDISADESFMKILDTRELIRLSDELEEDSAILRGLKICAQIAEQIDGQILIDKRNRSYPQFILTAPIKDFNR